MDLERRVKELEETLEHSEKLISRMGKMLGRPRRRGLRRLRAALGMKSGAKASKAQVRKDITVTKST